MLRHRLERVFIKPSTFDEALPKLSDDYRSASVDELFASFRLLSAPAAAPAIPTQEGKKCTRHLSERPPSISSDSLPPEQRLKLLGLHQDRVRALADSGTAGVYAGPTARQEMEQHFVLVRRTTTELGRQSVDLAALTQQVSNIVTRAQLNETRALTLIGLAPESKRSMGASLLGINSGNDEICEVILSGNGRNKMSLDAFDRAGFHVVYGSMTQRERSLYIDILKASHGRNIEDLSLNGGKDRVPGRGNTRAIAEALGAAVECALAGGMSEVSCTPASVQVAELYQKMGFVRKDGDQALAANTAMTLRLGDKKAVAQMVFVFTASRGKVQDVPKNVGAQLLAGDEPLRPPLRHAREWQWEKDPTHIRMVLEERGAK